MRRRRGEEGEKDGESRRKRGGEERGGEAKGKE